jgi:hypothetical protein
VPPGPQPHESAGATFAAFAGDPIDVKVDNEPAPSPAGCTPPWGNPWRA